jgi:hypothetical protein
MRVFRTRVVVTVAVLWCGTYLCAQTATTTLRGSVTDPSGAMIAGADVTLTNAVTDRHLNRATDGRGGYVFSPIDPGEETSMR